MTPPRRAGQPHEITGQPPQLPARPERERTLLDQSKQALSALGEQAERDRPRQNAQNLRVLLDNFRQTPAALQERQRRLLESAENQTLLDLQASLSEHPEQIAEMAVRFLEPLNIDPQAGNPKFQVNLHGKMTYELGIGLAHVLPPNVIRVSVTDLQGNQFVGVRHAEPKPGYYTPEGKYIAVFSGYEVEVLETVNDQDVERTGTRQEERTHYERVRGQYLGTEGQAPTGGRQRFSAGERIRNIEAAANAPENRPIFQKFLDAHIQLDPETFLQAVQDLAYLRREGFDILSFLKNDTLELFRIASEGGNLGRFNAELAGLNIRPISSGSTRLRNIPLFADFAQKLRDPIFSRAILGIMEREMNEEARMRGSRPASYSFDRLFEMMEASSVRIEVPQTVPAGNEYTYIESRLVGSRQERFVQYINEQFGRFGIAMAPDDILRDKPASLSDLQAWFSQYRGNVDGNEYDLFRRLFEAISYHESGGRYDVLGKDVRGNNNRAIGKYQIMNYNWKNWSREAIGSIAPPTALNQDRVAFFQMLQIYKHWRRNRTPEEAVKLTSAEWYGGRGGALAFASGGGTSLAPGNFPSIRSYVQRVGARLNI